MKHNHRFAVVLSLCVVLSMLVSAVTPALAWVSPLVGSTANLTAPPIQSATLSQPVTPSSARPDSGQPTQETAALAGRLLFAPTIDADGDPASNPVSDVPVPVIDLVGHLGGIITLAAQLESKNARVPMGVPITFRVWNAAGVQSEQTASSDAWGAASVEIPLANVTLEYFYQASAPGYGQTEVRHFRFDPKQISHVVHADGAQLWYWQGEERTVFTLVSPVPLQVGRDEASLTLMRRPLGSSPLPVSPQALEEVDPELTLLPLPDVFMQIVGTYTATVQVQLPPGDYGIVGALIVNGTPAERFFSQPIRLIIEKEAGQFSREVTWVSPLEYEPGHVLVQYVAPTGQVSFGLVNAADATRLQDESQAQGQFLKVWRTGPFEWQETLYDVQVKTHVSDGKKIVSLHDFSYDPIALRYTLDIKSLQPQTITDTLTVQVLGPGEVVIKTEVTQVVIEPEQVLHYSLQVPAELGKPQGLRVTLDDPLIETLQELEAAVKTVYSAVKLKGRFNAFLNFYAEILNMKLFEYTFRYPPGQHSISFEAYEELTAHPWEFLVRLGGNILDAAGISWLRLLWGGWKGEDWEKIAEKLLYIELGGLGVDVGIEVGFSETADVGKCPQEEEVQQFKQRLQEIANHLNDLVEDRVDFSTPAIPIPLAAIVAVRIRGTLKLGGNVEAQGLTLILTGQGSIGLTGRLGLTLPFNIYVAGWALIGGKLKQFVEGVLAYVDVIYAIKEIAELKVPNGDCDPEPPDPRPPDDRQDVWQGTESFYRGRTDQETIDNLSQLIQQAQTLGLGRAERLFNLRLREAELARFMSDRVQSTAYQQDTVDILQTAEIQLQGILSGTIPISPSQTITEALNSVYSQAWSDIDTLPYPRDRQQLADAVEVADRLYFELQGQELELQHELRQLLTSDAVGVVASGFAEATLSALSSAGLPAQLISLWPSDGTFRGQPALYLPPELAPRALVVPSGGLHTIANSPEARDWLTAYVSSGGLLVIFTQAFGADWTALPGGEVRGVGYEEDQRWQHATVEAGMPSDWLVWMGIAQPDIQVDGAFTAWPTNANILLKRTFGTYKGYPVMIEYPYGAGKVLATAAYGDWAWEAGYWWGDDWQMTRSVLNRAYLLARGQDVNDTFAAEPASTVTVSFPLTNTSAVTVTSVEVVLPLSLAGWSRDSHASVPVSLAPGAGTSVVATLATPPLMRGVHNWTQVGLYRLKATAKAVDGKSYTVSGPFVYVRSPVIPPALATNLETERATANLFQTVAVTASVRNYTDITHTVTISGQGDLPSTPVLLDVPPRSVVANAYTLTMDGSKNPRAEFYDESSKLVGRSSANVNVAYPDLRANPIVSPSLSAGAVIPVVVANRAQQGQALAASLLLTLTAPSGATAWAATQALPPIAAGQTMTPVFTLATSALELGTYQLWYRVDDGRGLAKANYVPLSSQVLMEVLPGRDFSAGPDSGVVTVTLNNTGYFDLAPTVELSLTAPSGATVWALTQTIPIASDQILTPRFTFDALALELGTYQLWYRVNDGRGLTTPRLLPVVSQLGMTADLDRRSYRIREPGLVTVTLSNGGYFDLAPVLNLSAPDLGLTSSQPLSLPTNAVQTLAYTFTVPTALPAGSHLIQLSSQIGSQIVNRTLTVVVPPSSLEPALGVRAYLAGDTIGVTLNNPGGVDATTTYTLTLVDSAGRSVAEQHQTLPVQAGQTAMAELAIPTAAVSGPYQLILDGLNQQTGARFSLLQGISITGVEGSLIVQPDRRAYFSDEPVTAQSHIQVSRGPLGAGTLNLRIYSDRVVGGSCSVPAATSVTRAPATTSMNLLQSLLAEFHHLVNPYIDAAVEGSGENASRFTLATVEGDPNNPNDNGERLLYGWPSPWSSFTSVRIGASDYLFGSSAGIFIDGPGLTAEGESLAVWQVGDVVITQSLSLVNSVSGNLDALRMKYTTNNLGSTAVEVGFRIMLDTQLGSNDGAPFRLLNGTEITTEREFTGTAIPLLWLTVDDLGNPQIAAQGQLGPDIPPLPLPDRWLFAYWSDIYDTLWDYTADPNQLVTGDSAVAGWWNPIALVPGATQTIGFDYGVAPIAGTSGDLSTAVNAPSTIADPSGNPFTVRAFIRNNTFGTAHQVQSLINLPPGLILEPGYAALRELGDLVPGQVVQVIWHVRATGAVIGTLNYSVATTSADVAGSTTDLSICVPDFLSQQEVNGFLVWETTLPVTNPTSLDLDTLAGLMPAIGHYYLVGALRSETEQVVATDDDEFFVLDRDTGLTLLTDKQIYRAGDTIQVSGWVTNTTTLTASMWLQVTTDDATLIEQPLTLAPGEGYAYTSSLTSTTDVNLTATANGVSTYRTVIVAEPEVAAELVAPEVVGRVPFSATLVLTNSGVVTASLQTTLIGQSGPTLTLLPGEVALLEQSAQINQDTTLTATVEGDVSLSLTKAVLQGERATLSLQSPIVDEVGSIEVPYVLTGTGMLPTSAQLLIQLDGSPVLTQSFIVLPDQSILGHVPIVLTTVGPHALTGQLLDNAGNLINQTALDLVVTAPTLLLQLPGTDTAGLIQIPYVLSGAGTLPASGQLLLQLDGSQVLAQPFTVLADQSSVSQLPPISFPIGHHTLLGQLVDQAGNLMNQATLDLTLRGPAEPVISTIRLTGLSVSPTPVAAGGVLEVNLELTNEGVTNPIIVGLQLFDPEQQWIITPTGFATQSFTFNLAVPPDMPADQYFGQVTVDGHSQPFTVEVAGASDLKMSLALDRPFYFPTDAARLTVTLTDTLGISGDYILMSRYLGAEAYYTVTVPANQVVQYTFDFTATQPDRVNVFLSNTPSPSVGQRVITLDSLPVPVVLPENKAYLTYDKLVYSPGDTLYMTAQVTGTLGNMVVMGPMELALQDAAFLMWQPPASTSDWGGVLTGTYSLSYTLPTELRMGRYTFLLQADGQIYDYPVDVQGWKVTTRHMTLDKPRYARSDALTAVAEFWNEGNEPVNGLRLTAWVFTPDDGAVLELTPQVSRTVDLQPGLNVITVTGAFNTPVVGPHRLLLNVGKSTWRVAGAAAQFDVGWAHLVEMTTDHGDYTPGEPGLGRLDVYGFGPTQLVVTATNGSTLLDTQTNLSGFSTFTFTIPTTDIGNYLLLAQSVDQSGNTDRLIRAYAVPGDQDTQAPTLSLTYPNTKTLITTAGQTTTLTVVGQAVDNSGQVTVLVNGQFVTPTTGGDFSWPLVVRQGLNLVSIVALDGSGNIAYSPLIPVTVLPAHGVVLTADRSQVLVGQPLTYTVVLTASGIISNVMLSGLLPLAEVTNAVVSASTGEAYVDSLGAIWSGDVLAEQPVTVTVQVTPLSIGTLTNTVTALWGLGLFDESHEVLVQVTSNTAPTVEAGPDQIVDVGSVVTFAGSFTDPDMGDTHTITWNFGDGSMIIGALSPTHVYTQSGLYTVTLTVADNQGGTGSDTLQVTVKAATPALACLQATESLDLRDRTVVSVTNVFGGRYFELGADARVNGDIVVDGNAFLRSRARVEGDLTLAGTLQRQDNVVIVGTLTEGAVVSAPSIPTQTVTFGSADLTVANGQVAIWSPGDYRDGLVRARGSVVLSAGTYHFRALNIEPDADVILDTSAGGITINLAQALEFGDRSEISASASNQVMFYTNASGTVRIGTDVVFNGQIVAPYARVQVFSRTVLKGCLAGKTIVIEPDARLQPPSAIEPTALYPIALQRSSLQSVLVGQSLPDVYNGTGQGNFGWLSWTGANGEPVLVQSLTPPGNSQTYINPKNPADHLLSINDWASGRPGVSNSKGVRAALDRLTTLIITVPVWDTAAGQGNNTHYHVVGCARIQITSYRLPGQNRLSAKYWGIANCQ